MISLFGSSLLSLSLFLTLASIGLNLWFIKSNNLRFFIAGRNALTSACFLIFSSSISLVYALYISDLSLIYVNKYSSIYTPTIYKIGGFWAGMEGSLLFWVFILSIYTIAVLYQNRNKFQEFMPWVTIVIAMVMSFFLFICTVFENPFTPVNDTIESSSGLNPLLQHWAMLIHPPMLYLGFIGFTIPYSFAISAIITKQLDASWIKLTRKWSLFTWMLLSIAVVMGG